MFFLDFSLKKLTSKQVTWLKNAESRLTIYTELMNSVIGMLEYYVLGSDELPNGFNSTFLELYKICNGHCIAISDDGKYPLVFGTFSGKLDYYGFGEKYVANDLGGNIAREFSLEDVVLAKNNQLLSRDLDIVYQYVYRLCECDKSLDCILINSRYSRVLGVSNDTEKTQLNTALNNVANGSPATFVKSRMEDVLEGSEMIKVYDLTDVSNSDKIQYISKYRDDLLRRFYTYFGHAMSGNQKIAQQSVEEISSDDTMSMIYPKERLKCAQEFCKSFEKKFGIPLRVKFSDTWERENKDIILGDKNSDIDDLGGDDNDNNE